MATPKYKFGLSSFLELTPHLFRRIGNALIGISTLGGTFAFLLEDKRIASVLVGFGVLGKICTEFFSQEEIEKCVKEGGTEETCDDKPILPDAVPVTTPPVHTDSDPAPVPPTETA